ASLGQSCGTGRCARSDEDTPETLDNRHRVSGWSPSVLTLAEVLEATGGVLRGARAETAGSVRFTRVVVDSREVTSGALFVALKGQKHDAHAFVAQALANGASGAIVERVPPDCAWALDSTAEGPPLVVVPSS